MEDKTTFRSYGIGSVLYDRAIEVDELPTGDPFPLPGQKKALDNTDFSIFACHHSLKPLELTYEQTGGPVPTALSVHSRWNEKILPTFFGYLGDDTISSTIRKDLHERRINGQFVVRPESFSPQSIVWIHNQDGARSILYTRGSAIPLTTQEIDHLTEKYPFSFSNTLLHIDATEPTASMHASRIVHERQGLVYLDTGDFKTYSDGSNLLGLLSSADIIQAPLRCAREIVLQTQSTKDNVPINQMSLTQLAEAIQNFAHCHIVVVTDGVNGAGYYGQSPSRQLKGHVDAHVASIQGCPAFSVDETSAGDIFAGSFSYALMSGDSLHDAARIASVTAASSTRFFGNECFIDYSTAKSHVYGRSLD